MFFLDLQSLAQGLRLFTELLVFMEMLILYIFLLLALNFLHWELQL